MEAGVRTRCDCGHAWLASSDLAGGIANCPRCGKAADVPGLRDGCWRGLQVVAVVGWVLVVSVIATNVGTGAAIITGLGLAAVYGLIMLAL